METQEYFVSEIKTNMKIEHEKVKSIENFQAALTNIFSNVNGNQTEDKTPLILPVDSVQDIHDNTGDDSLEEEVNDPLDIEDSKNFSLEEFDDNSTTNIATETSTTSSVEFTFKSDVFRSVEEYDKMIFQKMEHIGRDSVSGRSSFRCNECGKVDRRDHLFEHIEIHFNGSSFQCNKCRNIYPSRVRFRQHKQRRCYQNKEIEESDDKSTTNIATKTLTFTFKSDVFRSIEEYDKMIIENMEHVGRDSVSGRSSFRCKECGKVDRRCHTLEHIGTHFQGHSFQCNSCQNTYRSRVRFRLHKQKCLSYQKKEIEESDDKSTTNIVTKTSRSTPWSSLTPSNANCTFISNAFKSIQDFENHLLENTKQLSNGSWECRKCYKEITKKSYVYEHVELHFRGNSYQCNNCKKVLNNRSAFRKHNCHIDSLETSSSTKYISKSSIASSNFDIISNEFKTVQDFENTVMEMTEDMGNERWRCKLCQKVTNRTNWLFEHGETHFPSIWYKCKSCNVGLKRRYLLRMHYCKRMPLNSKMKSGPTQRSVESNHIFDFSHEEFIFSSLEFQKLQDYEETILKNIETKNLKWSCKMCSKVFTTKLKVIEHIEILHFSGNSFHCKLCKNIFKYRPGFRRHNVACRNKSSIDDEKEVMLMQEEVKSPVVSSQQSPVERSENVSNSISNDDYIKTLKIPVVSIQQSHVKRSEKVSNSISIDYDTKTLKSPVVSSQQSQIYRRENVSNSISIDYDIKTEKFNTISINQLDKKFVENIEKVHYTNTAVANTEGKVKFNRNSTGWKCKVCGKVFLHIHNVKEHLEGHFDDISIECKKCKINFDLKNLRLHLKVYKLCRKAMQPMTEEETINILSNKNRSDFTIKTENNSQIKVPKSSPSSLLTQCFPSSSIKDILKQLE